MLKELLKEMAKCKHCGQTLMRAMDDTPNQLYCPRCLAMYEIVEIIEEEE